MSSGVRAWRRTPLPAIAPTGLGRQENVKPLDDEPLCVCLLSAGYPPRSTEGVARSTHTLARGLAELGHEVHVVTAGDEHRVAFRDGAYVHEVRPRPHPHYAGLAGAGCSDLRAWLDYSHAVYFPLAFGLQIPVSSEMRMRIE